MLPTAPLSLLTATALFVLNASETLALAVPPLLPAALPVPPTKSLPLLLRLSPALLLLYWSELLELSELHVAVEFSLAFGPAPVCVEVAVAVWVLFPMVARLPDVSGVLLFVGLAHAVPATPKATAIEDAISVFFMVSVPQVGLGLLGLLPLSSAVGPSL